MGARLLVRIGDEAKAWNPEMRVLPEFGRVREFCSTWSRWGRAQAFIGAGASLVAPGERVDSAAAASHRRRRNAGTEKPRNYIRRSTFLSRAASSQVIELNILNYRASRREPFSGAVHFASCYSMFAYTSTVSACASRADMNFE